MASEEQGFLIVYGSQTGQAKAIAQDIHTDALAEGLTARLFCMDQFKEFNLSNERLVVCICSTTGEGDAPDNASRFWRRLKATSLSPTYLAGLNFTVLGLGDSNYTNFCNMGKQFDKRFPELGATRFYNAGFADDGVGLELVVEPWREGLFPAIRKVLAQGSTAAATSDAATSDSVVASTDPAKIAAPVTLAKPSLRLPKVHEPTLGIEFVESSGSTPEAITEAAAAAAATAAAASASSAIIYHAARLHSYRALTRHDAVKRALEIVIDVSSSPALQGYRPGDAFGIACPNLAMEVNALIAALGAEESADKLFKVTYVGPAAKKGATASVPDHLQGTLTLRQVLSTACDIRGLPKKAFVRLLADFTGDEKEKDDLLHLSSQEGGERYREECKSGTFTLERILRTHASCKVPVARVLENLLPLQPRSYSVCSSPLSDPTKVHFVFNVEGATSESPLPGICTTWLESKALALHKSGDETREALLTREVRGQWAEAKAHESGETLLSQLEALTLSASASPLSLRLQAHSVEASPIVPMYLRPHLGFSPPEDTSKPLIMIGPGTGVSPFIGFLRNRQAQRRANPSGVYGKTLLFFGCRNRDRDFLFEEELSEFVADGTLTSLFVAYSRDEGSQFKYVQDYFKSVPELAQLLLREEACVFACGSTNSMGVQLDDAIKSILTAGGLPAAEADTIFAIWRQQGRFRKEIWG